VRVGRPILCVGQLTADTNVLLDGPLVRGDQVTGRTTRTSGGTAAIVAHNAALVGAEVFFHGHVGADEAGRDGVARLKAAGVTVGSTIKTVNSPEVVVLVEPGGERTMVASSPMPDWTKLVIDPGAEDVVYFEAWPLLDDRSRDVYAGLIRAAAASGAFVALDVCAARASSPERHAALISSLGLSLLLANTLEAAAYDLIGQRPAPVVIVHAGANPTTVVEHTNEFRVPVPPATVIDSTGAGDTFASGVLVALSAGASCEEAVVRGHRAASRVLAIQGGLLPLVQVSSAI